MFTQYPLLKITNDYVFKKVFSDNPDVLLDFVQNIASVENIAEIDAQELSNNILIFINKYGIFFPKWSEVCLTKKPLPPH